MMAEVPLIADLLYHNATSSTSLQALTRGVCGVGERLHSLLLRLGLPESDMTIVDATYLALLNPAGNFEDILGAVVVPFHVKSDTQPNHDAKL